MVRIDSWLEMSGWNSPRPPSVKPARIYPTAFGCLKTWHVTAAIAAAVVITIARSLKNVRLFMRFIILFLFRTIKENG